MTLPSLAAVASSSSACSAAAATSSSCSSSSESPYWSSYSSLGCSLAAALASASSAASSAAAAAASAAASAFFTATRLPLAASRVHTRSSALVPTRSLHGISMPPPVASPFVTSSASDSDAYGSESAPESSSSSLSRSRCASASFESKARSRLETFSLAPPVVPSAGIPMRFLTSFCPPAPPPPSLDVNPTTSSTPGNAARRCRPHSSAALLGMASTLFSTSTRGLRSLLATWAYNAGGVCNSGCRASTTSTATSALSRTRHNWRHTSMFCSNAGAYPLPSSLSRFFTPEIHRTNALRSREWSLPRLSS
mmetsp:Transcript_8524/g.33539  ORF Transcript_8524/g.33539 Transcript_8524/m.33539 type:complete len:309 (-) Transcript_8524:532-1458(-)